MKSVIAFDVSMGKSYMVIDNAARSCIFEGEILHNRPRFEQLNKRIIDLVQKDGQVPAMEKMEPTNQKNENTSTSSPSRSWNRKALSQKVEGVVRKNLPFLSSTRFRESCISSTKTRKRIARRKVDGIKSKIRVTENRL